MGEGRGKLEVLIGELQAKKAELEKLIEEYELMLPHLAKAREALDEAGITDTGSAKAAPARKPAAAAPPPPPPPKAEAAAEPAPAPAPKSPPSAAESEPAPARRSIASLVAEDEATGDEATH
ncbi:MAG: hypothetical protein PVJ49_11300 [Acidobacteriota bacterium]|jgi:hypothetical protein